MGAFAAVAQGSEQEPALITLHYRGPGRRRAPARLRGQGRDVRQRRHLAQARGQDGRDEVRHVRRRGGDRGRAAIARLRLPVELVAVVGATENLPSGRSVKPGDIVTAINGTTIEVNNTDAEGRLVLADCLCHAVGEGAERIVDLATLTGAVIVALGSTYAGCWSTTTRAAEPITEAGARTGDRLAPAPARRVRRAGPGASTATSTTRPRRARRARSSARSSFRTSSATCRGRTWTSPARPGELGRAVHRQGRLGIRRAPAWRSWRAPSAPRRAFGIYGHPRAAGSCENACAMDFELSADHELIRRTVREFAEGEVAPVAEELDRTKSFPYEIVEQLGKLNLMGIPFPRGVRRRRRRHARLRARRRGAHAGRLLGGDHALRAHLAGHAADLPVRLGGAEARVAAPPVLGRAARRVRADRARGGLGRRQHAHARGCRTANG